MNEAADCFVSKAVIRPVAKAYVAVVPEPVNKAVEQTRQS